MSYSDAKMAEFVTLLERHTPEEGLNFTQIPELGTFREMQPHGRASAVYEPAIIILGQGKKVCYLDGHAYDFSVGRYLTLFLPMPIEVEVAQATPEAPLLMAGIRVDLARIASILVKLDGESALPTPAVASASSAIFAEPLNDGLLDPVVRLLRTLDNSAERVVLREPILEEIYFRLLCNDRSGSLRKLLQHHGHIQHISKAVDHIHTHLDETVSVEALAQIASMSPSGFRRVFREIMHMPPLQYAKSIKLNRAQGLIREGKNVSEAGYLVGYNSPAQFSREYKRHFGFSPSATAG